MRRLTTIFLLSFYLQAFSQQSIFVTISGGDLYKLNLSNCTSTFVGSTGQGFGDIAFTPNGKLWGIVGGQLYKIDTANASATPIGNTGVGAVSLVGLNDSVLLAEYGMKLYGINTINATSYYIDTIGYQAAGDLTWYDNDLYLTTGDQLIKIVLNGTNSAILSVTPINSTINPIPTCEGTATASFPSSDNSIIGFSSNNVYKICQIDGSYQMLCPTIVPGGIPGGASIRLAVQVPQPTSCQQTGISEQTIQNSIIQIYPNPFSTQTVLQTDNLLHNATLTVDNCFGQTVAQIKNINGRTVTFSPDNLASGLYFVRLTEETTATAGHTQGDKTIAIDKLVITDK